MPQHFALAEKAPPCYPPFADAFVMFSAMVIATAISVLLFAQSGLGFWAGTAAAIANYAALLSLHLLMRRLIIGSAGAAVRASAYEKFMTMAWLRPALMVFMPFAAGYYLSYLFRVINAVVAKPLADELELDAARLGLLTSVYFLTFAAVQLPLGVALDRIGPRRVQASLLMVAALGALTFAVAPNYPVLVIGRGLIGLGVAGALIAGLKGIAEWFPRERLPLINGVYVAFGAAGAVTATAPVEWLLTWTDWRGLFLMLAAATATASILIFAVVLEPPVRAKTAVSAPGIREVYADPRFWRLAPISALCIGSAWALQGLWAAPWLADVALLGRSEMVQHLFVMALALCASALLLGLVADRLRSRGIGPDRVFCGAACAFIVAELVLVFRLPIATLDLWALIAGMGAATVLSYSVLADLFPREAAGRANAALNLLHIGGAFAIQTAIGFLVDLWPRDLHGRYPASAYDLAFLILVAAQLVALLWFLRPRSRTLKWSPPPLASDMASVSRQPASR
jgi:MFS family permease